MEVYEPLLNCYSKEERETLEHATPQTFDLGMGKRPYTLDYSQKKEVVLRAILQDLYDVKTHPTIVFGKYPLVVEILAPNRRPVQRTSNLLSFWEGSYRRFAKIWQAVTPSTNGAKPNCFDQGFLRVYVEGGSQHCF